jgi:hypothetical protein
MIKKTKLSVLILLFCSITAFSQITQTGTRVGIGVVSPAAILDIKNTSNFRVFANDAGDIQSTTSFRPHFGLGTDFGIYEGNVGSGVNRFAIDKFGNTFLSPNGGWVGIGIWPSSTFHLNGNALFSSTGTILSAAYIRGNSSYSSAITPDYTWYGNDRTGIFHPGANIIAFSYAGVESMRILSNGSVGIGTTATGSFKLAVEGKIGAREFQVTTTNPWPDYVFSTGYKLRSIAEVSAYINEHKHLPGILSAREVQEQEGIRVGEMQVKLLEKIEELTLYIIQQNTQIEELKKQVSRINK